MKSVEHHFPGKKVVYYFDADFTYLEQLVIKQDTILITDENIYQLFPQKFDGWKRIVIKAGEVFKQQAAVDNIVNELIAYEADRNTTIIGVGGGVVTDIAGYAAGIYMRGLSVGFVPTTILGMVDAAIGGKNGVDVGAYKNLAGLIRQPNFLLFDYSFLSLLPQHEWINGFAEIIKHACIKDDFMFDMLEKESLIDFKNNKDKIAALIERNVAIKTAVVINDEFEKGDRKLLNFGHTFGHAIENIYQLPHGHAVSIGMIAACTIAEEINNFPSIEKQRIINLITNYNLPVTFSFDKKKIWNLLKMDKKRVRNEMNFILLKKIGEGTIQSIPINQLEDLIIQHF